MTRKKAAIMASGIDPRMTRLRKLHAIKSVRQKQLIKAIEDIESYWDEVAQALKEKEASVI